MVKAFGLSRTGALVRRARVAASLLAALAVGATAQEGVDRRQAAAAREQADCRRASDECAVWRREQSFARSVESHDARASQSFLHAGTVVQRRHAPTPTAAATPSCESWAEIVDGKTIALRWRPGIVQIGGEPTIAVSRGPYILQRMRDGAPSSASACTRRSGCATRSDGVWRVLFDGSATTSQPMGDRAAADRWVEEQAMSDCAS